MTSFPYFPQSRPSSYVTDAYLMKPLLANAFGAFKYNDRPSVDVVRITAYGEEQDGTYRCCVRRFLLKLKNRLYQREVDAETC